MTAKTSWLKQGSVALALAMVACAPAAEEEGPVVALASACLESIFKTPNEHGFSATFRSDGEFTLDHNYFTPQGSNNRHCGSCHKPEDGWSISPRTLQKIFDATGGLDPVFNLLDADRPNAFPSNDALRAATVAERRAVFTMLLQGKFTRRITLPATAQFEVTEVQDPFGVSTIPPNPTVLWFFRRALPTANLRSFIV